MNPLGWPMSMPNQNMSMNPSVFSRKSPQDQKQEPEERKFNLCDHVDSQTIDPQSASPFYNGRVPAEIRELIFQYALTESPATDAKIFNHDPDIRYNHGPVPLPVLPISEPFRKTSYLITEREFHNVEYRQVRAGFDWLRPDNTRPIVNHYNLLLTCRRVYLEAHALPIQQKEFVFYCIRGSDPETMPYTYDPSLFVATRLNGPAPGPSMPGEPAKQQRDLCPRYARLFTQQYWLEDTQNYLGHSHRWFRVHYNHSGRSPYLSSDDEWADEDKARMWYTPLEHLRITFRRADWWDWERNHPLKISPYRRSVQDQSAMLADMARADAWSTKRRRQQQADGGARNDSREEEVPIWSTSNGEFDAQEDQANFFESNSWGLAFREMINLKTLTIDFETSEDKKAEMEKIVEWALQWRFPLAPTPTKDTASEQGGGRSRDSSSGQHRRRYLSAEGQRVEKMSWRGNQAYWSMRCASCPQGQWEANEACAGCRERQQLEDNGLGPRLFVWTLTWRAVMAEEDLLGTS